MKSLLIKDGVVINAIVAPASAAQTAFPDHLVTEGSEEPGSPGPGWLYDGTSFSPPPDPT